MQLTLAAMLSRLARSDDTTPIIERIHASISRAVKYLIQRQSSDGAWRSEIYGPFKDGPSLTSLIAATFASLESMLDVEPATFKAAKYLATQIDNGPNNLTYPAYTAAGAVIALNQRSEFASQQKAWLNYLRSLQLTEDLGWQPVKFAYGGWSYAATGLQPLNGAPATPLAVPNLSATVFALKALRAAGVSPFDPVIQRAKIFVERCQNWNDEPDNREEIFDDGGFHFLLEDPQRNKAGEVGIDRSGRRRFASYGSATADGFRALADCGLDKKHPRHPAAEQWLLRNFSAENHPGDYRPDREHLRPALYYYYAASLAQCLHFSVQLRSRAAELASSLLSRQRPCGSWTNSSVDVREDDPLVATPLAIQALHGCFSA
jgi:squalene-hopene/tetraprenyl-beta-curcumene cyclase